ncbi:hypothetical protein NBRC13296_12200 [Paenibacillus chitinolyticus]|uniref:hypothetical protein n=1 Tax=Paenibacillus chitinolyticus TaxID=79263 RepID=UPI00355890BF
MDQPETFRKPGEDLDDYLVRLGDNFDLYGLTWTTASSLLNSEAEDEYSESKWRKDYNSYLRWKDKLTLKLSNDEEYLQEIHDKTTELLKEKIRLQDQKREYTTTVRYQARFEHLKNEIHKSILALAKIKPLNFQSPAPVFSDVRANILWSDWHYGSDFKNSLNEYNPDIFRARLQRLVSQTIKYIKLHKVNTLTVGALGDFLAGAIHISNRVQSSETIIEQIQVVSEALAESLAELSKHVQQICFINIIGNHARLIPNKTESILNENLENLIPWYLHSRLKDFKNVEICQDTDGYYVDNSFSPSHVYVHGDLDHVSSVAKTIPQVIGVVPRYIFCGHIHHDTVKEHGRTKVISNGSLIGVDDYAVSKRLYAEPMQKMHIFNGDRIEYTIDIPLNRCNVNEK